MLTGVVTRVPEPSFSRSVSRAARDRQYPVARLMLSKTGIRRLLETLGAPLPGEFRELGGYADITAESLARRTVIKPVRGANNRGVFPLLPEGPGLWRDLEHEELLTLPRIHERLAHAIVAHGLDDRWIGEELLLAPDGEHIDDVKFLMFRGRVGAAFVRRNPEHSFTWYDAEWRPISSGIPMHRLDLQAPPPAQRDELTALAVRLSRALPLPFVRVDLYGTAAGPVVGELTPFPGWANDLGDELDAQLGRLYEAAENALIAEGMDWRRVTEVEGVAALIAENEKARTA